MLFYSGTSAFRFLKFLSNYNKYEIRTGFCFSDNINF